MIFFMSYLTLPILGQCHLDKEQRQGIAERRVVNFFPETTYHIESLGVNHMIRSVRRRSVGLGQLVGGWSVINSKKKAEK